ncbi:MAG: hypothetical protein Q4F60_00635, partial [Candidatus Saccharibacteria bacterium]|nr:hypothetical protein [Candidatus Saccharibacteria bacterium]
MVLILLLRQKKDLWSISYRARGYNFALRAKSTRSVASKNLKQDFRFLFGSYRVRTYGSHPLADDKHKKKDLKVFIFMLGGSER